MGPRRSKTARLFRLSAAPKSTSPRVFSVRSRKEREGRGCAVHEVVVPGTPHREILRIAGDTNADLVVMGVRGRGAVDLTLFGSTTNQVVRRAACAVLTVRSN